MRACRQVYSQFSYSHNPPPERNGQDMINFRGHGFGLLIGAKALPIHFNIQSNYTSWLDMKFQMPSQAKIIHSSVAGLMSKTCFKCHDQRIQPGWPLGWSEKHKSWKMQNYRADSEPRHSTDFRTHFETMIRLFVS